MINTVPWPEATVKLSKDPNSMEKVPHKVWAGRRASTRGRKVLIALSSRTTATPNFIYLYLLTKTLTACRRCSKQFFFFEQRKVYCRGM